MNNINIDHIGDDLAKAYAEGYEQGKFDMMNHIKGEWIEFGNKIECPFCKYSTKLIGVDKYNYCPRCGADMRDADINVLNKESEHNEWKGKTKFEKNDSIET